MKIKFSYDISNDILKESAITYFAMKKDYILSNNHLYFKEIIKKKIMLGEKNIKIKFCFDDCLSQYDIINLVTRKHYSCEKIINYINEKIDLNNNLIKKLEFLLNSNLFINELYLDFGYTSPFYISYKNDKIQYKEKETDEEKNVLINSKLKRAELINQILNKNCKYITKMKYMIIEKRNSENIDIIFPLVDLDKYEKLISLDLNIFVKGSNENFNYSFTNNLNQLKCLKIKIIGNKNNASNIYINKNILDNLEILNIKDANWYIPDNEFFHFKNIKYLHIKNCFIPEESFSQKKYFFEELLKGNISWEKLEKLKIALTYGY